MLQGEILGEKLIVPRLRVRKDWYQNLAPDPTDHTHPDLGINPDAQDGTTGEAFPLCRVGVMPGAGPDTGNVCSWSCQACAAVSSMGVCFMQVLTLSMLPPATAGGAY